MDHKRFEILEELKERHNIYFNITQEPDEYLFKMSVMDEDYYRSLLKNIYPYSKYFEDCINCPKYKYKDPDDSDEEYDEDDDLLSIADEEEYIYDIGLETYQLDINTFSECNFNICTEGDNIIYYYKEFDKPVEEP